MLEKQAITVVQPGQERWGLSASSEVEGLKQVHSGGALQDGGLSHGERSSETT